MAPRPVRALAGRRHPAARSRPSTELSRPRLRGAPAPLPNRSAERSAAFAGMRPRYVGDDGGVSDAPGSRSATVTVLTAGYASGRVASTVAYVHDGDVHLVVDPGMVADRSRILDPLAAAGVAPEQVSDVVFSHHHPDHTLNAALFGAARFHDHWAIYRNDEWTSRDAEGAELSPSIRLIRTPGHTAEDITTLVGTADRSNPDQPPPPDRGLRATPARGPAWPRTAPAGRAG